MTFNKTQLNDIAEYASLFFSPVEIAVLIEVNIEDFCDEIRDLNSIASWAYFKAKYLQEAEIRKQVIKLAKRGSPQAEDLANKYILIQTSNEIDM